MEEVVEDLLQSAASAAVTRAEDERLVEVVDFWGLGFSLGFRGLGFRGYRVWGLGFFKAYKPHKG